MLKSTASSNDQGLNISRGNYVKLVRSLIQIIATTAIIDIGVLVVGNNTAARLFSPALILVGTLATDRLLHSKGPRAALISLFIFVWLGLAHTTLSFAGLHTDLTVLYPFLIAATAWTLGRRWMIAITVASMLLFLGVGLGEWYGVYQPTVRAPIPISLTIVMTGLAISSLLSYLALRSHNQSIEQASELSIALAEQNMAMALQQQELQTILDAVPGGIAKYEPDGKVIFCNRVYAGLFGLQPKDLCGRLTLDVLPTTALESTRQYHFKALSGQQVHHRRILPDATTGEDRHLDVTLIPLKEDDRVVAVIAQVIDVTEKVMLEAELRDLNEQLEQRVEARTGELADAMDVLHRAQEELLQSEAKAALGAMVASVTHEMNTPLGNSVMAATTLEDQTKTFLRNVEAGQLRRSDLTVFLDSLGAGTGIIRRNLERASHLLQNFKQVAADQTSEQRRKFDLAGMINDVLSMLQPQLKRKPHHIMVNVPSGLELDSYPGPLGQVLINLINNAYLHAFEGMEVGELRIDAEDRGDSIHLKFVDNGVGMSHETLTQLFQPFFSTKIGRGGTGLGMTIVEGIVRKTLGGSLHVESEPGKGTRFDIHLPRSAP